MCAICENECCRCQYLEGVDLSRVVEYVSTWDVEYPDAKCPILLTRHGSMVAVWGRVYRDTWGFTSLANLWEGSPVVDIDNYLAWLANH